MEQQVDLRDRISFRIAPLLEMALSLLVVINPERFGAAGEWVERVSSQLAPSDLDDLRAIAADTDLLAVACELEEDDRPVPAILDDLSRSNPQLGEPLRAYWTAFAPETAATAGILGDSILRESRRLREIDPLTFITDFSDRVNVSDDGEALVLEWGRGMQVSFDQLRRIEFVPSTFCPRRMMFYRHRGIQILFYNPVNRGGSELCDPPESLVLGFAALADATRLKLLKLIARENLPAQEMARRLAVHESTVSRHLKFLLEAGHVARRRQEGKYIYYTLNLDRLDTLTVSLRGYLE